MKIKKLISLEGLYIDNNNLDHIPKDIGHLTNLKKIHINFNKLNHLPKTLNKLENLEFLCCFMNPIKNIDDLLIKDKIISKQSDFAKLENINITNDILKKIDLPLNF